MTDFLASIFIVGCLIWTSWMLLTFVVYEHRLGLVRVRRDEEASWDCTCNYSRVDHLDGRCERKQV